jgi:2-C-methyl-D-erythritol 4-phosphate cytidylyltransferase
MNIIMIMSGGVGHRFGAEIPKQYTLLKGRPVIDYVIDVAQASEEGDRILVVMDPSCKEYSEKLMHDDLDFANSGKERLDSLQNGFNFITENYPECEKIIILDAVAPFVTSELIDFYLRKLDDNDAVITCQKITGALGNYDFDPLDRDQFYMTQSPEAFRFKTLMPYFDPTFPSQELAWQLPRESKKFLYFGFPENLKLTYAYQKQYAEYMLDYYQKHKIQITEE